MIFTFLFFIFLSISSVKNNQIDCSQELKTSHQREKDLNQTIDQILEAITSLENKILHLEDTIAEVASEATRNTKHIEDNAADIVIVAETISSVKEDVSSVNTTLKEDVSLVNFTLSLEISSLFEDVQTVSSEISNVNSSIHLLIDDNKRDIEDNKKEIEENRQSIYESSLHGQWCAYQDGHFSDSGSLITYDDEPFFADTAHMSNTALNTETGKTLIHHETSK